MTSAPVLVIGGGGVAGIAWALGVLNGLGDALPSPSTWSTVVGTSAGATVAAQLLAHRLEAAYETQFQPSAEIVVDLDLEAFQRRISEVVAGATSGDEARSRLGRLALDSDTPSLVARRGVIQARLNGIDWPIDQHLVITAVDAHRGTLVQLTAQSGVALVDAVMASSAVPGVWPVVPVGDTMLMDGGMRSTCNADLGPSGRARLVLVPSALDPRGQRTLARELDGTTALVIEVDSRSRDAIGANPLDPARRPDAARAGRAVGEAERERVSAFLAGLDSAGV